MIVSILHGFNVKLLNESLINCLVYLNLTQVNENEAQRNMPSSSGKKMHVSLKFEPISDESIH